MTKLAIAAMAALFATAAMAADLPLKRAQAQPDYPDYAPQARLAPPVPFPQPQIGFQPGLGVPPPVNPCIAQAAVFPPPLPFLGLEISRGFGGGHRGH